MLRRLPYFSWLKRLHSETDGKPLIPNLLAIYNFSPIQSANDSKGLWVIPDKYNNATGFQIAYYTHDKHTKRFYKVLFFAFKTLWQFNGSICRINWLHNVVVLCCMYTKTNRSHSQFSSSSSDRHRLNHQSITCNALNNAHNCIQLTSKIIVKPPCEPTLTKQVKKQQTHYLY